MIKMGKLGRFFTSYYPRIKDGRGIKICISQFPPKWLKEGEDYDFWMPELAPTTGDLMDYKHGKMSLEKFKQKYEDNVLSLPPARHKLKLIRNFLNKGHDVTVYCYEVPKKYASEKHPYKYCHREELRDYFSLIGYESEEL